MVETLVACAEFGQPVAITPFLLAGASAPVTLAAGLSLLVAETLAGVAMAQLIRPGTPCILGCFFNGVDMRSGGPSPGLPESVLTTLAGAQLARGTACRCEAAAGCVRGSRSTRKQPRRARCRYGQRISPDATSSFTRRAGSKVASSRRTRSSRSTSKSSGCSSGCATACWSTTNRWPSTQSPTSGPGGLFLAHEHTLARFRTDVFMSPLFRSQAYPTWVKQGSATADEVATGEWHKMLDSYVDPGIPDDIDAELRAYIDQRAAVLEA